MATIKFSIKSKKSFAPIYVRMQHSRLFDFEKPLPIYIEPKNFDAKNQRIRRVAEIPNYDELNLSLNNLRNHLFTEFNNGIITGENFTKKWFDNSILKFFNVKMEDKTSFERLFFTDFCEYWMKEIAPTHRISAEKYIDKNSLKKYITFISVFKSFQGKSKIKFKDLSDQKLEEFGRFLIDEKMYGYDHSKRLIQYIQFFGRHAEKKGIEINPEYKNKVILSKQTKKDCIDPYLTPEEINTIFELDLSHDQKLDNVRDNLIISVWTGLRVSDFLRLKIDHIQGGNIEIRSTQKTGIGVVIPIHPMVQQVLDKREGNLPNSLSDQKYNVYIKEVAKLAGLNEIIVGSKSQVLLDDDGSPITDENNKNVIRKVHGNYPKHELITSHIGRRSFATNLFGKVPNSVIMATGGWKSEQMMLRYIKKTKNDHVEILANFWNRQETPSSQLKAVND